MLTMPTHMRCGLQSKALGCRSLFRQGVATLWSLPAMSSLLLAVMFLSTGCPDTPPTTQLADVQDDVDVPEISEDAVDPLSTDCSECHGTALNAAPPLDIDGASDTRLVSVGAHQAHMVAGNLSNALACSECHVEPGDDILEHVDERPAEMTWGDLATTDGAEPQWDTESESCSDTYCHGATLEGGDNTSPVWTRVDDSQVECQACHGNPPLEDHPNNTACHECHAETVDDSGELNLETHIDGILQADVDDCSSCHGGGHNSAPPVDLEGRRDTSLPSVGAHQAHLNDGSFRIAMDCSECHVVPEDVDDEGHLGDLPAEITWGPLATNLEQTPEWDSDKARCTDVYCHGATLSGGMNTDPTWTADSGTQTVCGSCHSIPPMAPHVPATDCYRCHNQTMDSDQNLDLTYHINGVLDMEGRCGTCHGDSDSPAPPNDLLGNSERSSVTVGAHRSHLSGSDLSLAVDCDQCHVVPDTLDSPGHLGAQPADLTFGDLATLDGALIPDWDREAESCSDVYCHGATLSGGLITEPQWTAEEGTQTECGSCHGAPPPAPHIQRDTCWSCHPDTMHSDGTIIVEFHINGTLDVTTDCNGCHGNETNNAPPADLDGNEDHDFVTVGAHQSHLTDGGLRRAVDCTECHVVPQSVGEETHMDDSPADLTWGPLATARGELEPEWDRDDETCSEVYCHGATLGGGVNMIPDWTARSGTQAVCGACHGVPPPAPHMQSSACYKCHPDTVNSRWEIINIDLHIDGEVQRSLDAACGACHSVPPQTGSHLTHYSADVDSAAYGSTAVTSDILPDGESGYALGCGNCHPTASSAHANSVENAGGGSAEIELSPVGAPDGSLRALHLESATYTPGDEVFTDSDGMTYTMGTCSDVYCHSEWVVLETPDGVPIPQTDFEFTNYPIEYPDYEVVAERQYSTPTWGDDLSCDGCHGFPPRTYFDDGVDAAAGDSHSYITPAGDEDLHGWAMASSVPIACATCHFATVTEQGERGRTSEGPAIQWSTFEPIPIADYTNHVNGQPDIDFTDEGVVVTPNGVAKSEFSFGLATYDSETRTCNDVSCHFNQTSVTWGAPYRPEYSVECDQCHNYGYH